MKENVYLKIPTMDDKVEWLAYVNETRQDNPTATPGGFKEETKYDEWLNRINNERENINLPSDRVQSSFYFLMSGNRIIGSISIRHSIDSDMLRRFGGHIGYNIRPSERRKGYATKMLYLGLEKCNELGLNEVMVTCKQENIGSAKTIENNCGIMKEMVFVEEENTFFKKYWINVKEALNQKVK